MGIQAGPVSTGQDNFWHGWIKVPGQDNSSTDNSNTVTFTVDKAALLMGIQAYPASTGQDSSLTDVAT